MTYHTIPFSKKDDSRYSSKYINNILHNIFTIYIRYEQKEQITSNKQRPGRPRKCRAFVAGLRDSQCLDKNVVYCFL